MLFVAAMPGLVFGLSGISDPQTVDTDIDLITLLAGLFAAFGPAMLAVFLLWRDRVLARAGFARPAPRQFLAWSGAAFGLTVAAAIVAGMILAAVLSAFGAELPEADRTEVNITGAYLVIAFIISATAGISEEIVYRAYGITRMEQAGWPRAAAFVPLLVWTGQHLYQGWAGPIIVGAVGIPLVIMFRSKRSVWPLIAGHLAYDVLIFLISASTN